MKWLRVPVTCVIGAGTYFALPELLVAWFGAVGAIAMIPVAGIAVAIAGWMISMSWKF